MNAASAVALLLLLASPAHALTRTVVPGGVYGERCTTGETAVLIWGSHVQTHLGNVALPPDELRAGGKGPLYTRIRCAPFAFAGQSHAGLGTWQWRVGIGWTLHPPACGVSPVIYTAAGDLLISDCSVGSQGFRYIDRHGRPISGDMTYADIPNRIWEWTEYDGVRVGQGNDGCISIRGIDRRMLERGDCRFVRFHLVGQRFSMVMSKFEEGVVVLLDGILSDLSTFPQEAIDVPPPPPPPPPPPQVPPFPEDIFAALQATRARYPTPFKGFGSVLINEIAHQFRARRAGLESKVTGNTCRQPKTDASVSCDIFRIGDFGYDVIRAEESDGQIVRPEGGAADPARFVAPVDPDDGPPPPPPPPDGLEARVRLLESEVLALTTRVVALRDALTAQAQRIAALEQQQPSQGVDEAAVKALIDAELKALRFKVLIGESLSRPFRHTHSGTVEMIR